MKNIPWLLFFVLVTLSILEAQEFNLRMRNDYVSTEFFNLHLATDTIIVIGFGVEDEFPFDAKINIMRFHIDGSKINNKLILRDSVYEYFPRYQNATSRESNHNLIQGAGGISSLNSIGFIILTDQRDSVIYHTQLQPVVNSITQICAESVLMEDLSSYTVTIDRNSSNIFTARLTYIDDKGNVLWEKHYSDPVWNYTPFSMIMDKDSNLIVGLNKQLRENVPYATIRSTIWKLDKEGNMLDSWEDVPLTRDVNKILQSADGGYMFVDRIHLEKDGGGDFLFRSRIVKLDADLDYEWEQQLGLLFQGTELYNIKALKDGNYIAVGKTSNLELEDPCSCGHVVKFSESGDIIWESFIGKKIPLDNENTFTQNRFYDIVELDSGGFVACGASYGVQVDSFPQQAWLVRMDEKGQVVSQWDIPRAEPSVNVQIVPNPAQDLVRIRIEDDEILERYELYDQQGAIVQSGFPKQVAEVLDVSRLPAGVYYIRVNGQSVGKMVKQ